MTACSHTTALVDAHHALFYRDADEYLEGISSFIRPGLEAGEAVVIAVPTPNMRLVSDWLGDRACDVEMLDMAELGRNPGRIIPAVQAMIDRHGPRALNYVGEPIWAGRSAAEIREATRHEALINVAWRGARVRVLCPYDAVRLDDAVLADAERTHPVLVRDRHMDHSPAYSGPTVPPGCEQPLPEPPAYAATLPFDRGDLGRARTWVAERAAAAGLLRQRSEDLVIAVNELTTNTVRHARSRGVLRFWRAGQEVVLQVEDSGHITDPLAGRRRQLTASGGLGLWIVNALCDLVEIRTGRDGTVIRVHAGVESGGGKRGAGVDTGVVV